MNELTGDAARAIRLRRAYGALELGLMLLLALQLAILFWALATPLGPVGDWRAPLPPAAEDSYQFAALGPLFGFASAGGPVVVSDLELDVYGVRMDRATGRGAAIIGGGDTPQRSFAVGEEIAPGVTLEAVNADHVVLLRGGRRESLFLDQSQPARRVGPEPRAQPARVPTPNTAPAAPVQLARELLVTPRLGGGDGMSVRPGGTGTLFRESGLRPGDVVLAVDGTKLADRETAERLLASARPGQTLRLEVERKGETIPISIRVPAE